jgi:hypothetical protein
VRHRFAFPGQFVSGIILVQALEAQLPTGYLLTKTPHPGAYLPRVLEALEANGTPSTVTEERMVQGGDAPAKAKRGIEGEPTVRSLTDNLAVSVL